MCGEQRKIGKQIETERSTAPRMHRVMIERRAAGRGDARTSTTVKWKCIRQNEGESAAGVAAAAGAPQTECGGMRRAEPYWSRARYQMDVMPAMPRTVRTLPRVGFPGCFFSPPPLPPSPRLQTERWSRARAHHLSGVPSGLQLSGAQNICTTSIHVYSL